MKENIYRVHIRNIFQDYKFSCVSDQAINKHIKHFILLHGYRFNIIIRNYYTN